jgi:hypothetical protein
VLSGAHACGDGSFACLGYNPQGPHEGFSALRVQLSKSFAVEPTALLDPTNEHRASDAVVLPSNIELAVDTPWGDALAQAQALALH